MIKYPNIPSGFLAPLDRLALHLGLFPIESSFQLPFTPPADHKYRFEDVVITENQAPLACYGTHVPDDFKQYLGLKNPTDTFPS